MTTLYKHSTGPLIEWDGEFLHVEDLNPHIKTRWRMTSWGLIFLGLKAIFCGLFIQSGY